MKGVQNSYEFASDFSSDFSEFPQSYATQQQYASMATENVLQQLSFCPGNTMISKNMGLSQYGFLENESSYDQSGTRFFGDSSSQAQTSNGHYIMPNGSYRDSFSSLSENNQILLHLKHKLLGDLDDSDRSSPALSFGSNQDPRVISQNLSASHLSNINQFENSTTSGNNSGPLGAVSSAKTRIRWTQALHDRFVDCVNVLGGPDKATPKAILKMMDREGLTILHIKSHLQKYRSMKYVPESGEGRSEKKTSTNNVVQIDIETGIQLKEALQLQVDVQKHLHEQLEMQRKLQLRIEEQGKQLKMMLEQQQKTAESTNSSNLSPAHEDPHESDDKCVFVEIK